MRNDDIYSCMTVFFLRQYPVLRHPNLPSFVCEIRKLLVLFGWMYYFTTSITDIVSRLFWYSVSTALVMRKGKFRSAIYGLD